MKDQTVMSMQQFEEYVNLNLKEKKKLPNNWVSTVFKVMHCLNCSVNITTTLPSDVSLVILLKSWKNLQTQEKKIHKKVPGIGAGQLKIWKWLMRAGQGRKKVIKW